MAGSFTDRNNILYENAMSQTYNIRAITWNINKVHNTYTNQNINRFFTWRKRVSSPKDLQGYTLQGQQKKGTYGFLHYPWGEGQGVCKEGVLLRQVGLAIPEMATN
jgi:hypothetical protein